MRAVGLVDMFGHPGRKFRRLLPIKPTALGETAVLFEVAVEFARIDLRAVGRQHHGGRGDRTTFRAQGGRTAGQHVTAPAPVGLGEMRHVVEHGGREIKPAARLQRRGGRGPCFDPTPADVGTGGQRGNKKGGDDGEENPHNAEETRN